jgi:hypothetical protein
MSKILITYSPTGETLPTTVGNVEIKVTEDRKLIVNDSYGAIFDSSEGGGGGSGSSGTSGISGTAGTSGVSGSSGTSGTSGISGTAGTSGTSGISGSSGSSGANGAAGTSGTSAAGAGAVKLANQTITATGWTYNTGTTYYEYTYSYSGITTGSTVDITPYNASLVSAQFARIFPYIQSNSGNATITAMYTPGSDITGEIIIR